MRNKVIERKDSPCSLMRAELEAKDASTFNGGTAMQVASVITGGLVAAYDAATTAGTIVRFWECPAWSVRPLGVGAWGVLDNGVLLDANSVVTYEGKPAIAVPWRGGAARGAEGAPLRLYQLPFFLLVQRLYKERGWTSGKWNPVLTRGGTYEIPINFPSERTDLDMIVSLIGKTATLMVTAVTQGISTRTGKAALELGKALYARYQWELQQAKDINAGYAQACTTLKEASASALTAYASGLFNEIPVYRDQLKAAAKYEVFQPRQELLKRYRQINPGALEIQMLGSTSFWSIRDSANLSLGQVQQALDAQDTAQRQQMQLQAQQVARRETAIDQATAAKPYLRKVALFGGLSIVGAAALAIYLSRKDSRP